MNGKVAMKLTMELQGHYAGVSENTRKPGEMVTYTAIWGTDTNGRYARAITYGTVAVALSKSINAMLSENEVVSSKRAVVTLNGEWQTRSVTKNGKEEKQRNFVAREAENAPAFNILDGMALEAARLRSDATQALRKAESLRSKGQLALAYEAVSQFVANYAGVPLDLEKFLADNAADDVEFGAIANSDSDPEAAAAAHFARDDVAKGISPSGAERNEQQTEATSAEEVVEAADETTNVDVQAPMEFGADDEVLGADANFSNENVAEEDAITIDETPADETDVLDDTSATAQAEQEAPRQTASSPFGSRPAAFGSRPGFPAQGAVGSRPFSRPEPVRQAPQSAARPVPSASERPAPQFVSPRGPKF
jgi:metal-sulfur cluster biosynthetic enzyme